MIRKLRRRITCLFAALASAVLITALALAFQMAQKQYKSNMDALLTANLASLEDQLSGDRAVSDGWLAEREASTLCIIYIEDNGTPLHFRGAWTPRTARELLLGRAKEEALQQDVSGNEPVRFLLYGDAGEPYKACMKTLEKQPGQIVQLIVIQDVSAIEAHLQRMLLCYCAIALLGCAALAGISWRLSGIATRPTSAAMQRQNEFVAAASHELRNPLAVMKASLDAADEARISPEKRQHFLSTARSEADRMARLTDDLLLLASGDAKAMQLYQEAVPMDTFLIELYEKFYLLAQQKQHLLTLQLPDTALPTIQADPLRLMQLFGILLSNALEYTPVASPIEITGQTEKQKIAIHVIDHGTGISDADKERIFDRFYRADQSRSDKAHLGLGLSVAQQLAALHSGKLSVTDTPGGGATFGVFLPLS